ncbi:sensor histidine kinase, partial [Candidatus Eisenbacteria bacterium]
ISWSADNLLDGVPGELEESQAEYIRSIKSSAGHLTRMVSILLEISHLERGENKLELEQVDLAGVLERAIGVMDSLANEKKVRLTLHPSGEIAPVRANADKLMEVAINLFDNAIKYTPSRSEVNIEVGMMEAGRPGFSVRDRGPGLGSIDADTLFGRFKQGAPSPHSRKHGFGLGLHIVKSYMELMQGEVRACDHHESGAVFTCLLSMHDPGGDVTGLETEEDR